MYHNIFICFTCSQGIQFSALIIAYRIFGNTCSLPNAARPPKAPRPGSLRLMVEIYLWLIGIFARYRQQFLKFNNSARMPSEWDANSVIRATKVWQRERERDVDSELRWGEIIVAKICTLCETCNKPINCYKSGEYTGKYV